MVNPEVFVSPMVPLPAAWLDQAGRPPAHGGGVKCINHDRPV
jgi:hypothetical protein